MTRPDAPLEAEPIDARGPVTLGEVCRACAIEADTVIEYVEVGVIEPEQGRQPQQWRFSVCAIARLQRAVRLHRDLAVDLQGAALALDLLEELDELRRRVRALEGD
jgi:chaperone modulatory protein CbpM